MPPRAQAVQLSDVGGVIARRWPTVLVFCLLGVAIGAGAFALVPAQYTGSSSVSVRPINTDPFATTPDARAVSMATEQQVLRSPRVAAAAGKILESDHRVGRKQLLESVSATSPDESLVLEIDFTAPSPDLAAAGADAFAKAYLDERRADAEQSVTELSEAARDEIERAEKDARDPDNASDLAQRSLEIQVDSLSTKLADLSNLNVNPGTIVGDAVVPDGPSTLGLVPLAIAGLVLGLLAGIGVALLRRREDVEIGSVDNLTSVADQLVLDGTKDAHISDTWDIAAFMLKLPTGASEVEPYAIMVDAAHDLATGQTGGSQLVEAMARRGRPARYVDASVVNEGKISRGWPTEKKRMSWAGEVVVIDTSKLSSDAHKVAIATRSDTLVLARHPEDDAASLNRLVGLLSAEAVDIALTVLLRTHTSGGD